MICALILLLLVGGVLLILGIEGKHEGDEPRCGPCGYNLTGLTADRCPECGSNVSEDTVAWGVRRRNRPALITSVLLLGLCGLGAASLVAAQFSDVNWYRLYPTTWLLSGARTNTRPHTSELNRRVTNGLLKAEDRKEVATFALAEHGARTRKKPLPIWADLLAMLDGDGVLSKEQQEQFYRGLAPVELSVRHSVRVGEPIIIKLELHDHGPPSTPYLMYPGIRSLTLDPGSPAVNNLPFGLIDLDSQQDFSPLRHSEYAQREGSVAVDCVVNEVLFAPKADPLVAAPLWSTDISLSDKVQVLPATASDPIRMIQDAGATARLKEQLTAREARLKCSGFVFSRRCHLIIYFYIGRAQTLDLAFDVFVSVDGEETPVGTVSWAIGKHGWAYSRAPFPIDSDTERVRPILRASRDAAAHTVACYNVLDTELRLSSIMLSRD